MVYDKRLFFGVTLCKTPIMQRDLSGESNYLPGTVQTIGHENYGFQTFQYPVDGSPTGTIGNVFVGVKSATYITTV